MKLSYDQYKKEKIEQLHEVADELEREYSVPHDKAWKMIVDGDMWEMHPRTSPVIIAWQLVKKEILGKAEDRGWKKFWEVI